MSATKTTVIEQEGIINDILRDCHQERRKRVNSSGSQNHQNGKTSGFRETSNSTSSLSTLSSFNSPPPSSKPLVSPFAVSLVVVAFFAICAIKISSAQGSGYSSSWDNCGLCPDD